MKRKYIIGLGVILILAGGYYYHSSRSKTGTISYVTAPAEKGTITSSISGSGNVVVDQLATVDPTITGTIANLSVNVGDTVTKGQYLFTIVNNDLSVSSAKSAASIQQSKNAVDSAIIAVKQAKADYSAAKKDSTSTRDQKSILKKKITLAENGLIFSQKSYSAALVDFRNEQSTAGERTVVAPIAGTVNAINVKNGDALSRLSSSNNNSAPIVIGDLKTLKAQVQVNEVDIPNVFIGQKVMMTFSAIDELSVSGTVEKVDSLGTITQGVVNYNVTIGLDTLDEKLRPGMSTSAKIITQVKQDTVTVPNSALKTEGNKTYIEVLNKGTNVPERRNIEIGIANNADTEILSGVSVGDDVITQTIDPNAKVTTTTGGFRFPGAGGGRGN